MSTNQDYELWIEPYICSYHREHPNENYPGCSCHSGFWMCKKGTNAPIYDKTLDLITSLNDSTDSFADFVESENG